MTDPRPLPDQTQNRDLRAIIRRIKYLGSLGADPTDPGEGTLWVRNDVAPPEIRVRLGSTTFKVTLTAI